ncbi:chromosome segregation ATPase [Jiangella alkaliphila]|uniref:Chromosome segregation ATPase n=2 Tax=Jiangella alkaliphila TaxID=419479 RepID=A0A1H2HJF2_9ACTN|nr:ParA family protein [Jiangella alkaliphila]SDU31963.1 chromosome segregation ATPase [Jiangella alkaliphila]
MTDATVVAGLGWPAAGGVVAIDSATGERRSANGWPCISGTIDPTDGPSNLEREISVNAGDRPADPAASTHVRSTADLADFAMSGSLADLDTPIAREAAVALMAVGRRTAPMPKPDQMRVMVVANQKGGVGKTTTTVNLAAALAVSGLRVLVVDLDPQGNASTALGIDHHAEIPSIYDVMVEETPVSDVVQKVEEIEGLWCVPATIDLAGAEIELVSMVARESRMRKALDQHLQSPGVDYDYVFIDCPPSLGLLTVNALVGGDEVLIPIQCEYYALEGLSQLLKNIDMVRAHLNRDLAVSTILLTMYDGRTRLAAQVADEVRRHFGDTVLKTAIPRSVRISEAPSYGQTVMTYDAASSGALSYLEAAREIAERGASGSSHEELIHG